MNLLGAGSYSLGQWGILIVIAKWDGTVAVGAYALGLAAAAPIVLFTNLNLAGVLATDARHDFSFGDYLGLRILSTLLAFSAILVLAGWVASSDRLVAVVLVFVGLAKAVDAMADVFYGRCQQMETTWPVAVGLSTNGVVSLIAVAAVTVETRSVVGAAIASVAGSSLALLVAIYLTRRSQADGASSGQSFRPRVVFARLSGLVKIALPLGVVMCLISLNANIPRYFIERFLGPSALGGFAVVASIQLIVATVLSAVGQSTAPRMATEFTANHKKAFVRLLYELLAVAMALSCGLVVISVVLGRQVLTFLFRPEYAQYRGLLILLSVVTLVSNVSVCLGFAITAARSYGRIALVYVATSVAIAIGCSVLVPAIGLSGAAWAMLIGSLVCGVGSILIVVDRLRVGPRVIGSVPS